MRCYSIVGEIKWKQINSYETIFGDLEITFFCSLEIETNSIF